MIQTAASEEVNCTVKNKPACESVRFHREINVGRIGPAMIVGNHVRMNPNDSRTISPVRLLFVSVAEAVAEVAITLREIRAVTLDVSSSSCRETLAMHSEMKVHFEAATHSLIELNSHWRRQDHLYNLSS